MVPYGGKDRSILRIDDPMNNQTGDRIRNAKSDIKSVCYILYFLASSNISVLTS